MYHLLTIPTLLSLLCGTSSLCQASSASPAPKGFLGVIIAPTPDGAEREGVLIRQVETDSAADRAGLRAGDVIERLNGRRVEDPDDLQRMLADYRPGKRIKLNVWRDGEKKTVRLTLQKEEDSSDAMGGSSTEPGTSYQGRYGESSQQRHVTFLGVRLVPVEDLTPRLRKQLDISDDEGLVVLNVLSKSPAARVGLRHGDVITEVNGKDVDNMDRLNRMLSRCKPGERLSLKIQREGESKKLNVELARRPADFPGSDETGGMNEDSWRSSQEGWRTHSAFLGVQTSPVDELSSQMKKRFKVKTDEGLVVTDVVADSPAEKAGFRKGDVIKSINDKDVDSHRDLQQCINHEGPGAKVKLEVNRSGREKDLEVRLAEVPANYTGVMPAGGTGGVGGPPYRSGADEVDRLLQEEREQLQLLQQEISRLKERIKKLEKERSDK